MTAPTGKVAPPVRPVHRGARRPAAPEFLRDLLRLQPDGLSGLDRPPRIRPVRGRVEAARAGLAGDAGRIPRPRDDARAISAAAPGGESPRFRRAVQGRGGLARSSTGPPCTAGLGDAGWAEVSSPADDDPRRPQGPPAAHRPDGHRHAQPSPSRPGSARRDSPPSPTTSTPSATASNRSPRIRAITSRTRASITPSTSAASSAAGASRRSRPRRSSSGTWPRSVRQAGTSPAGAAVLDRDVQLLEGLGAAVPSATKDAVQRDLCRGLRPGGADACGTLPAPVEPHRASWARPAPPAASRRSVGWSPMPRRSTWPRVSRSPTSRRS